MSEDTKTNNYWRVAVEIINKQPVNINDNSLVPATRQQELLLQMLKMLKKKYV